MPTVWIALRAIAMSGLDDRDELYRSWYAAVDLAHGDVLEKTWRVFVASRSRLTETGVNLLLSGGRLIFEPFVGMHGKRALLAPTGVNRIVEAATAYQEKTGVTSPLVVPLDGVRVRAGGTDRRPAITVHWPTGHITFIFAGIRVEDRRWKSDEAVAGISRAITSRS